MRLFLLLSFMLMLMSFAGNAQDVITSDSAYIALRNDTFFQMRVQVFASGRKITEEAPLGVDTVSAVSALIGQGYDISQEYARALSIVENETRFQKTINGISAAINNISGLTYYRQVDNRIGEQLIGNYRIKSNGSPAVDVTVIRTNAGLFRLRQGNTNYVIDMYSDLLIRVRDYNNETFFLVRPNANTKQWTGLKRKYILTRQQ